MDHRQTAWPRPEGRRVRALTLFTLVSLGWALPACNAGFSDYRPSLAALPDGSSDPNPAASDLGGDFGGPPGLRVLARGAFTGRAGHNGAGTAELRQLADGSVELGLGADFSVSAVPGPVVVLTSRSELGTTILPSAGDFELGPLRENNGAQTYPVPGGDGGRRIAFVFCKPFGVEVARTLLSQP